MEKPATKSIVTKIRHLNICLYYYYACSYYCCYYFLFVVVLSAAAGVVVVVAVVIVVVVIVVAVVAVVVVVVVVSRGVIMTIALLPLEAKVLKPGFLRADLPVPRISYSQAPIVSTGGARGVL